MRHPLTAEEAPTVEIPDLEFTAAEIRVARERQTIADRLRAEAVLTNLDGWEAPLSEDAERLLTYIDNGRELTSRASDFGQGIKKGQEEDYRKFLIAYRKFLNKFGEFLGPSEYPLLYLHDAEMNAKRLTACHEAGIRFENRGDDSIGVVLPAPVPAPAPLPSGVRLALIDADGNLLATQALPETKGVIAEKVFEDLGKIIDSISEMRPAFEALANTVRMSNLFEGADAAHDATEGALRPSSCEHGKLRCLTCDGAGN